jgi:Holliday junction resolvase RusA-like endonuclease
MTHGTNNHHDTGPSSELERRSEHAPLVAHGVQAKPARVLLVRVTSIRKRLIDEDNLCEKYHIDCLRYAGLIPDDSPDKVRIQTTQRKAAKDEEERVIIEILPIE